MAALKQMGGLVLENHVGVVDMSIDQMREAAALGAAFELAVHMWAFEDLAGRARRRAAATPHASLDLRPGRTESRGIYGGNHHAPASVPHPGAAPPRRRP